MSEKPSEQREREAKILSAFLRKSARESDREESISVSADTPSAESLTLSAGTPPKEFREESAPSVAVGTVVKSSEENPFAHLSPEGAEMLKRMTDSDERVPLRSLSRVCPEADELSDDFSDNLSDNLSGDFSDELSDDLEASEEEEEIEPTVPAAAQEARKTSEARRIPAAHEAPATPLEPFESAQESGAPKNFAEKTAFSQKASPADPADPVDSADTIDPAESRSSRWENPEREAFFADDYLPPDWEPEPKRTRTSSAVGPLMAVSDLHKGYIKGKMLIPVLRGVDAQVRLGEFLSIVGQSGSGKSTLLHLMGTLDRPDRGAIHFDGQRIDNLPGPRRDLLRNRAIGMIFQFYHLIPEMTMIENVLAPLMIRESILGYFQHRRRYHQMAKELLERVGLGHRVRHKPNELSGGEMQRTAIARALITEPRILLADEPTGNLDSRTSREIIKLLRTLNEEQKLTIVMVTHDRAQAEEADRYIRLVDGQVVRETES